MHEERNLRRRNGVILFLITMVIKSDSSKGVRAPLKMMSTNIGLNSSQGILLRFEARLHGIVSSIKRVEPSIHILGECSEACINGGEASIQVGIELSKEGLDINRRRSGNNRRCLWRFNIIIIILRIRIPNPLIVNQVKFALPKRLLINKLGKRKGKIHGAINVLFKEDVGKDGAIGKGLDKIGMTVVYGIDHIGKNNLSEVDANIVSKAM
ncbi:hypothetical protein GQ457_02G042000 [Hibiscus cannabinus]